MNNAFFTYTEYYGPIVDDKAGSRIYGYENYSQKRPTRTFHIPSIGGCFGYVMEGQLLVTSDCGKSIVVQSGFWFSTPDGFHGEFLYDGKYRAVVFQREQYSGVLSCGLVEKQGRLKYIDGCHDSILHAPIIKGMPCLNALYMPKDVNQTMHTHPSTRAGFIIVGNGAVCETPQENTHPLLPGMIFYLPADSHHKFRSDLSDDVTMMLVAYHPDSDFGPTHEEHPMLNRTIVDGVSAKQIKDIQTQ